MEWAYIAGGFLFLTIGGELIVRGGGGVAARLGVPPMIIGVVLLGFGTSSPELVTSIQAAVNDAPGIALGNIVGSNIANLLLIAGVAAALSGAASTADLSRRDSTTLALATAVFALVLIFDWFNRVVGALFLYALAYYLYLSVRAARREGAPPPEAGAEDSLAIAGAMFTLGVAATVFGAKILVDGAVSLAETAGLSQALIGATIVAIGTSLPELAATIAAAARKRADLAIGNVIGSNIFNILAIGGVTAVIAPLPVPPEIAGADVAVMVLATAALLLFCRSYGQLTRLEGGALLAGYAAFLGLAIWAAQGAGA